MTGPSFARKLRNVVRGLYYALPKVWDLGNIGRQLVIGTPVESWAPLWSSALFGAAILAAGLAVFARRNY